MYVCMCVCMYVCMYECMYVHFFSFIEPSVFARRTVNDKSLIWNGFLLWERFSAFHWICFLELKEMVTRSLGWLFLGGRSKAKTLSRHTPRVHIICEICLSISIAEKLVNYIYAWSGAVPWCVCGALPSLSLTLLPAVEWPLGASWEATVWPYSIGLREP